MISILDIFELVFSYMINKKSRVFLTVSGIVIGIFTFTFFIFVSQGLSNAISGQFTGFGVNVLAIQPITGASNGPPTGQGLTKTDITKIKQVITNYKYIAPAISFRGLFEYGRKKAVLMVMGFPASKFSKIKEDLGLVVEKGRFIKSNDRNVVVIGAQIAKNSFGINNRVPVGASLKIGGKNYRVIGVLKSQGTIIIDNAVMTTLNTAKILSGQDTYSMIRISFKNGTNLNLMQQNIENKLNPNPRDKKIKITSPKQIIARFNQILGILTLIISFISSIALAVGGINVLNTMYSNVLERTGEISIMKAIGATNLDILIIFLIESSFLGLFGALIGFFLSYSLAEILSFFITHNLGYNVPIFFNFGFFFAVISITTIFTIIFGVYPAFRASKIKPGDNLRDE